MNKKKLFTLFLSVCMLLSIMPVSAFAASAAESARVTNGYYDATGTWKEGGNGSLSYDDGLVLSKTATAGTDPNEYTVNLKVSTQLRENVVKHANATVLVIDMSSSMNSTRLANARKAAKAFINEYQSLTAGSGCWVSLVTFGDSATVKKDWLDISYTTNRTALLNAIDALTNASGGTNLDAGIEMATAQFTKTAVSKVELDYRATIILTDGQATYATNEKGNRVGSGSDGSEEIVTLTTASATELKKRSAVYTICLGAADEYTWREATWVKNSSSGGSGWNSYPYYPYSGGHSGSGWNDWNKEWGDWGDGWHIEYKYGPKVGEFLRDNIATKATATTKYAYTASTSQDMSEIYENIYKSFKFIGEAGTDGDGAVITDTMPEYVTVTQAPRNFVTEDGTTYTWTLNKDDAKVTKEGDTTTYVYTLTYKIKIDANSLSFIESVFHPANGRTYMTEDEAEFDFPVPGVKGQRTEFTVTFNQGDHGDLAGQDAKGNVYKTVTYGALLPAGPAVTADDGYYFIGWGPGYTSDVLVTKDVTFTAQYAAKNVVTLKGDLAGAVYNGKEQTSTAYSVQGLPGGVTLTGVSYLVAGTDAGEYTGEFDVSKAKFTKDGEDVTDQYSLKLEPNKLAITKREVLLTSGTATREYNGEPLTEKTVTAEGFADGEGATYNVTGTITDAGSVDNEFTYTLNSNTKASNYTITTKNGTLTVSKRKGVKVLITGNYLDTIYDGELKVASGYELDINDPLYDKSFVKFGGEAAEAKRIDVGTTVMGLTDAMFTNQNKTNFEGVTFTVLKDGYVTVRPKDTPIYITADSANKPYDGKPLTKNTFTYTQGILDKNHTLQAVIKGSQTNAGTAANVVESYKIVDKSGTDVTKNYTFGQSIPGELVVTPATVTMTSGTSSKIYDALPLTNGNVEAKGFADGEGATYKVTGSQTDAGYSDNLFTYKLNEGTLAKNYNIKQEYGTLTVNKLVGVVTVHIDGNKGTLTYNGAEQSVTGHKMEIKFSEDKYKNALTKEDIEFIGKDVASGIDIGTYPMGLNANDFVNKNAKNVEVIYYLNDGSLQIDPVPTRILITANSNEQVYNGKALTDDGYTYTQKVLQGKDVLTAKVEGSQTNAGFSANKVTSYKVMRGDVDATKNYLFETPKDGVLTVTPAEVTMTSGTDSKDYDGKPLTNDKVDVTGFVGTDGATYDVFGTITNAGSTSNGFNYTLNAGTLADNYDITKKFGTLTVNKRKGVVVTIEGNTGSYTYDGTPKTVEDYKETITNDDGLYSSADYSFIGNATVTATNAGTYPMGLQASDFSNTNPNFDEVTFKVTDGSLTIARKGDVVVTITEHGGSYTYDGTEKTVQGYDFSSNSPLYLQSDCLFVGSDTVKATNAGTYPMQLTSADFVNLNENFENVTFNIVDGSLIISKKNDVVVTITEHSGTYTYDGTEKTVSGYDFSSSSNLYTKDDITFTGTDVVKATNAGTYPMQLTAADFTNENPNFDNVTFNIVDGSLKINKKTDVVVTITEHSGTYTYDGTEKKVEGYDFSSNSPLYTKDDITFDGTDVVKATNAGTYPMQLKAADFGNKNSNFDNVTFVITDGSLTIDPVDGVTITITGHTGTYTYDGTEKTVKGYDFQSSNPLFTKDDLTFTGTAKVSGTDAGEYAMGLKKGDFTNNSTNFTNVTFEVTDGGLTIDRNKARELNATPYKGVYDGKKHNVIENLSVTGDDGSEWTYSYEIDGKIYTTMPKCKDVGEYKVTVIATNPNYEPISTTVIVKVTPATIKVKADDKTMILGEDTPKLTYTVDTPVTGETPVFSGKLATDDELDRGTHPIEQGTLAMKAGDDFDPANYKMKFVDGTMDVQLRDLTIKVTVNKKQVKVGQKIIYTVVVTNTGDVDLKDLTLTSDLLGTHEFIKLLKMGESQTFQYEYLVKKKDAGKVLKNTFKVGNKDAEASTTVKVSVRELPQTGNETNVTLLVVPALISAAYVVMFARRKKKEEDEEA